MDDILVESITPDIPVLKAEDSLKRRYLFKLIANIFGLLISLVTQAIIPRGLGPKAYGDFSFLTNFFNEILTFMDMGTSIGFYTKLSKRPKESSLVTFYLYFSVVISIGIFGFVAIAATTSSCSQLWPGQELTYIYMAAGWAVLNWLLMVFNKMTDAYGITVLSEIVRMVQKIIGLLLIVIIYRLGWLNLTTFFYYNYFIIIVLAGAFVWIMVKHKFILKQGLWLTKKLIWNYCKEFYEFSHPLIAYALVAMIAGIFDRWLLQRFAGSVQQGFFGLSNQIGALCFLFTGAMTPLITREFSIAFTNIDLPRMASLFRRYIPLMYAIAAYISCFVAVESDKVVYILGGKGYAEATTAVKIMAFYPLFQTYGQLSGAVFYATGQTKLYSKIGILSNVMGPLITYILIAPDQYYGMNSGATGLAIKMLLLAYIGINIQLYFNTKYLKLDFIKYVSHQVIVIVLLLTISIASVACVDLTLPSVSIITKLIISGLVYSTITAIICYYYPYFIGLDKQTIKDGISTLMVKIKSFNSN